jgi:hypothetical protein
MNGRRISRRIAVGLVVLSCASLCRSQTIGVYDALKITAERPRLEKKTNDLWNLMFERLLDKSEKDALRRARLEFPTLSSDGSLLNFQASAQQAVVQMPIHSLLLLEDICTAYAWLHQNGFSAITVNEYASLLKYRQPNDFPGGAYPPPLKALGIPEAALKDMEVDGLSLRFRNSAYAYVLAHEMGHILYRHPGNRAAPPDVSRSHERQADEFALKVLQRDHQIPMGAILFFQMTAFVASPGRFEFSSVEAWQKAVHEATHPVTSERIRGFSDGLRRAAGQYGENREVALDVAQKLTRIAEEMDDRDWQLYFQRIGQRAPLTSLQPRRQ